jgi:hypothetical protein
MKLELLEMFLNFVLNKYVNKKEKGQELVGKFLETEVSPLFLEFSSGK